MLSETVRLLSFEGEGWIVDGTVGLGGHAGALLEACGSARLLGLDLDSETLEIARERLEPFGSRAVLEHGDYADMAAIMKEKGIPAARAVLLDLGWSSEQLARPERGFSFAAPGPLDMRYDRESGIPLTELLERTDAKELEKIIREYGEERWARAIARRIKKRMDSGPFEDTADLADAIAGAVPRRNWPRKIHPATRTFQALRIAVNRELERLDKFLLDGWKLLEVGGRIAIVAFHSLEDRRVKRRFTQLSSACTCPPQLPVCRCGIISQLRLLTRGALRPTKEETERNPRARSARLRAAERIA